MHHSNCIVGEGLDPPTGDRPVRLVVGCCSLCLSVVSGYRRLREGEVTYHSVGTGHGDVEPYPYRPSRLSLNEHLARMARVRAVDVTGGSVGTSDVEVHIKANARVRSK